MLLVGDREQDRRPRSLAGFLLLAAFSAAAWADVYAFGQAPLRSEGATSIGTDQQRAAADLEAPAFESPLWRVVRSGPLGPDLRWELSEYRDTGAGVDCAMLLTLENAAPSHEAAVFQGRGFAGCQRRDARPMDLTARPKGIACGLASDGPLSFNDGRLEPSTDRLPRLDGVCP